MNRSMFTYTVFPVFVFTQENTHSPFSLCGESNVTFPAPSRALSSEVDPLVVAATPAYEVLGTLGVDVAASHQDEPGTIRVSRPVPSPVEMTTPLLETVQVAAFTVKVSAAASPTVVLPLIVTFPAAVKFVVCTSDHRRDEVPRALVLVVPGTMFMAEPAEGSTQLNSTVLRRAPVPMIVLR